jgi:hypothetical protein
VPIVARTRIQSGRAQRERAGTSPGGSYETYP